jgi:Family of unknown function (DUF6088)
MTISETIKNQIDTLPLGKTFTAKSLLKLGSRASVDQTLSRLCKAGIIRRVTRGVYVKPVIGRLTGQEVLPDVYSIVKTQAEAQGTVIAPHGAVAVNRFGLSTQNPVKLVLLTSGRSKTVKIHGQEVRFQHVAASRLLEANTLAGLAITALHYLGPEKSTAANVQRIFKQLPEVERSRFERVVPALPAWMISAVHRAGVLTQTGSTHA